METLQGLLEQGRQRVARLARAQAEAQAQQSLLRESRQLLQWAEGVWAQLRGEKVADVASARRLLMEHTDLLEDIQLRQERSGWGADRAGFRLAKATRKGVTQGGSPG